MNKKFFGALTGAAILLSQGSPILAQEMVEIESGSVPGTDIDQVTEVKLDEVNFPDDNFRQAVIDALNTMTGTNKPSSTISEGDKVSTTTLGSLLTLSQSATAADDKNDSARAAAADVVPTPAPSGYTSGDAMPFKDLTGIEYLTGLQYLTILNSPQLKVVDLSENSELVNVTIVPFVPTSPSKSVTMAPAFTDELTFDAPSVGGSEIQINQSELYSIVLPEETDNLVNLTVAGANQLTTLDLSTYSSLEEVNLQLNELADLNVSGCSSLEKLNVSGNELTSLDLSTNSSLTTLTATDNNLYEITFPSGKKLTTVDLSDNKLATIDVSSVKGLVSLLVNDNRLETLDVSSNGSLATLNVANNHLATLDVSESGLAAASANITASPQFLYANVDDSGIDLASYDENFQASSGSPAVGWDSNSVTSGKINKSGVFELGSVANTLNSYEYKIGTQASTDPMRVVIVLGNLMNRLYNPNSGEHFYTADLNEKDTLVKLGWQYEGIGWVAPQENSTTIPTAAGDAVFRLYNPNAGDHHYTKDSKEKDVLVRAGWNYEGVGWYSAKVHNDSSTANNLTIAPAPAGGSATETTTIESYSIQVYREYNPNAKEAGAHNYTTSENENDTLVALGWLDEGIGWWALK